MRASTSFSKMNKDIVSDVYSILNSELNSLGVSEIIYVHGGAVMCELGAREFTRDIDAYYKDKEIIERATRNIVVRLGKSYNVINDDIRPFLSSQGAYLTHDILSNLEVKYATEEYLFALKCNSCRTDSNDISDLIFLVERLGIRNHESAEEIIGRFFNLSSVNVLYKDILEDIWNGTAKYYL